MAKTKVLATFMESGMGHITSVQSIVDGINSLGFDDVEVVSSYIMQEDNDKVLKNFENFIINCTQKTNRISGFGNLVFAIIEMGGQGFLRFVHKTLFKRAVDHTLEAFKKRSPDLILSTHYFMTYCANEYKLRVDKNVKIVTYNPDNNVHPWWDNRDGLFIVNNTDAYYEAIGKRGFNPERVREVFFTARNELLNANGTREEYREKYGIPKDKFCVMVADGVYAMGKADAVATELLKTKIPLTVLFLAGKNEKLFEKYSKLALSAPENLTIIPVKFTLDAPEYYAASDLFITKGGPNAILDSVFMHTPVIVDLYGHPIEKATAKLFCDSFGCGKLILQPKKVREAVEFYAAHRDALEVMTENTMRFDKQKNGSLDAARLIREEIDRNELFVAKDAYTNRLYELAKEEKYDVYTTPYNVTDSTSVDEKYNYEPNSVGFKAYRGLVKSIIRLFGPVVNYVGYHIKIEGRKNLKGVKNGITISNHVHYLDALWNFQVMYGKRFFITGAEHNLKRGFFGATMKAGGFVPLAKSFSGNKRFNEFLEHTFEEGGFVHFYPEQALWLRYEDSRPLKKGAFFYAAKYGVPIIPIVICFREKKFPFESAKAKDVTVKICHPIYPDKVLSEKENCERMNKRAQEVYDKVIYDFYHKDLSAENKK